MGGTCRHGGRKRRLMDNTSDVLARWRSSIGPSPGLRVALCAGVIALVLGYVGFGRYGLTANLDRWDKLYQSVQLYFLSFDAYRPTEPMPLQLQIARWLAPISTAFVLLGFASSVLQRWFDRGMPRFRRNHVVIVASADRAVLYDLGHGPVVHVDEHTDRVVRGWHHVRLSSDERWIEVSDAVAAQQVVIATGDDARNLALLGEILARAVTEPGTRRARIVHGLRRSLGLESTPEVVVENSDWTGARWLTLGLTRDHPTVDVRVLCPDEMVVHRVVRELEAWLQDRSGFEGSPPSVAVVGEAPLLRLLPLELVPVLERFATDLQPELLLVSTQAEATVGEAGLSDLYRIEVRSVGSIESLEEVSVAVIAHRDEAESTRAAVQIEAQGKAGKLFAPAVRRGRLPLSITPLEHREPSHEEVVEGPLTTAAKELWSDWSSLSTQQRRARLASLRRVLKDLMKLEPGSLVPRRGVEVTRNMLRATTAERLGIAMEEYGHLPHALRRAGFTYRSPLPAEVEGARSCGETTDPTGHDSPRNVSVTDEQVRQLARRGHEAYLRRRAESAGGHRAAVRWDALHEDDRQQNIQQVWHTLRRQFYLLGLHVVPLADGGLPATEVVTAQELECMAMLEHERWMELKLDQDYAYGEARIDDPPGGSPRRHPDLVDWEDLSEDVRKKDRNAMLAFLDHLDEEGLGLGRHR